MVEMRITWTKAPEANLLLPLDILSVDHDGNPGGEYNDPATIFSKIFWDNDNDEFWLLVEEFLQEHNL